MLIALVMLSGLAGVELDPAWHPVDDPLAPVRAGQVQCITPDTATKTCEAIVWTRIGNDGALSLRALQLVAPGAPAALESWNRGYMSGGRACTRPSAADMAAIRLVRPAAPYAPMDIPGLTVRMRDEFAAVVLGKEMCTAHYRHAETGALMQIGTIDNEFVGDMMAEFAWVDPNAGYRLRTGKV